MKCLIYCNEESQSENGSSLRVKFGIRKGILVSQRPVLDSIKQLLTIFKNCINDWYPLSLFLFITSLFIDLVLLHKL